MAADRKSLNREAIEKFASHFDPPLQVVATDAIGGARVAHGWMCAKHMQEHEIGLTAVCWGKGHFKAWLEATGSHDEASFAGQAMAKLITALKGTADHTGVSGHIGGGSGSVGFEFDANLSDNMSSEYDDEPENKVSPQTEQLQALGEGGANYPEYVGSGGDVQPMIAPRQPNPAFIDMMGLSPLERAKACDLYPELRFSINAGKRYDHTGNESERAGFISSEQLEHVNRVVGGHKLYSEDPATCEHKFKKNSIGGGSTCIRCGTSAPPDSPDAAA